MKKVFHIYILSVFFLISILFIIQGCFQRRDLDEYAKIPAEDIPEIIYFSPETSALDIPLNAKILVKFSLSMKTDTVESNFTVSCNDSNNTIISGSFAWNDDNTGFLFTPNSNLPEDSEITVCIKRWAQATTDNYLNNDFVWSFHTSSNIDIDSPFVTSYNPQSGEVVTPETDITIEFSEPMMKPSVELSFHIETDNDYRDCNNGDFTWNNNTVTYHPDYPLEKNKIYRILLEKDGITAMDYAGNSIVGFDVTFYTTNEEIYVSASNPNADDSNDGSNRYLPVKSLSAGLQKAIEKGYLTINISNDTYNESLTIDSSFNGLTITGGWNSDFTNIIGKSTIANTTDDIVKITGASNIELNNLDIINNSNYSPNRTSAILIYNSNNITFTNVLANGTYNSSNEIYGFYIDSSSEVSIIASSIIAGKTSNSSSAGVYITGSTSITIRDCSQIYGGDNNGADTYGILLNQNSSAKIYRNVIVGGYIDPAGSTADVYSIYIDASNADICNNFIVSSKDGTNTTTDCYGVLIQNLTGSNTVNLVNNTIDGKGEGGGTTYCIYTGNNPFQGNLNIINNIINGGSNNNNSNIFFIHDPDTYSIVNNCSIQNNIFKNETTGEVIIDFPGTTYDIDSASVLNGSNRFDILPEENSEYDNSSYILKFVDTANYNYHIDVSGSTSSVISDIANHGFSSSNQNFSSYSWIYSLEGADKDIDKEDRPYSNYANIDLGADEFQQ